MRLWTLHPKHLDARGLVALWREGLLAQAVLRGRTKGYRSHPQLTRFRSRPDPVGAIGAYLRAVCEEAEARGYSFDARKIVAGGRGGMPRVRMAETTGQIAFEWAHLKRKLRARSSRDYRRALHARHPVAHPLFVVRPGPVRTWEKSDRARPDA